MLELSRSDGTDFDDVVGTARGARGTQAFRIGSGEYRIAGIRGGHYPRDWKLRRDDSVLAALPPSRLDTTSVSTSSPLSDMLMGRQSSCRSSRWEGNCRSRWQCRTCQLPRVSRREMHGKRLIQYYAGIVLAIGSTENRIQIFTSSTLADVNVRRALVFAGFCLTRQQFKKSLSLEGHSDWVRSLTFIIPIPLSSPSASTVSYDIAPGELLLASGSQDNYIRLWRFSRLSSLAAPAKTGLEALDELERELAEAEKGGEGELRVKAHDFFVQGDGEFECSAEAVILGHDAWVTGLHWAPLDHSSAKPQVLRLLSASADRSMILWTPSSDISISKTSIWTPTQRFGEFSSATNLGFFGALFGYQGRSVLAHGWGGAFHCWREEEGGWEPILGIGGHFGAVKGVDWEREGEFLLSAGGDMTTRMHAPWRRMGLEGATSETWHELVRPAPPVRTADAEGRVDHRFTATQSLP